eukprot:TRINITY_DN17191_c1_g1_i1.p1 TRINITY_DN17191_c1_g1~~TRINITY_DN17191_c1_g1_i1.p1  ORF type:complete len:394 (+),score=49.61 TRINITY_DN17191_c1_g1_i1:66-1247(+)
MSSVTLLNPPKLSLRGAVLDDSKTQRLRLLAAGMVVLLGGQIFVFIYFLMSLETRLDQILKSKPPDSFKDPALIFCIVTGVVSFGGLGCYSTVNAKKGIKYVLTCIPRFVGMLLVQVFIFIPIMLVMKHFDCHCVSGGTIGGWMNFLGAATILRGFIRFFIACTKEGSSNKPQENQQEQLGNTQTSSNNGAAELMTERRSTIPIVNLLISFRQFIQGIALIVSSTTVQDNVNNVANDNWVTVMTPILACYGCGVVLTFVTLLAIGCPTALQRQTTFSQKIRRAFWNLTGPVIFCFIRLFCLIFFLQLVRWQDTFHYYPNDHVTPFEVVVWGFLVAGCIGLLVFGLIGFILHPQFYKDCAEIVERDTHVAIEEGDDVHSMLTSRRPSFASTITA